MTSTVALRLESKRGSVVGYGVVKSACQVFSEDLSCGSVFGSGMVSKRSNIFEKTQVHVFLVLDHCEDIASLFLPGAVRGKFSGSSKLRSPISCLLLKLPLCGLYAFGDVKVYPPDLVVQSCPAFCHRIPEQSESAVTAVLLIQVARLRGVDVCKCITTASLMLRLRGLPL
ncbi:hypothetical protein F2Q70_00039376 [Brassica cretica]|uniref:Uncharacterized protein n=1 Tax=Brassica cretica TaxID=69181 RepID=A0A8S9K8G5_BRACR|nr:hypothetical protein F2Q70_00039376 [Brassica cretica]